MLLTRDFQVRFFFHITETLSHARVLLCTHTAEKRSLSVRRTAEQIARAKFVSKIEKVETRTGPTTLTSKEKQKFVKIE